jgi:hypothetical protein
VADPPDPPWPPPDPKRPFTWRREEPKWGAEGPDEDVMGCLMVSIAAVLLGVAMVILYFSLMR